MQLTLGKASIIVDKTLGEGQRVKDQASMCRSDG